MAGPWQQSLNQVVEAGVAGAKVMGKVEGIVRRSGGVEVLDGAGEQEKVRGRG